MRRLLSILFLLFTLIVSAQKPAESVVAVKTTGSKFQFVNTQTGVPLNQQLWDEADPFINGYARVLLNNKFSFVNTDGKLISPVEFESARNFSNKLCAVKKDDKWGFINESGKIILPFKYEIVFDFEGSVSVAFGNKKWWLINNKGEVIEPLDISVCYGFVNGVAKVSKGDREGIMYPDGKIIYGQPKVNLTKPIPYHPKKSNTAYSQFNTVYTPCPDNLDFEFGNFTNWQCYLGQVDSVGNTNVITVNPSPPTPNRHTLYQRVLPSAIDPYGLFPTNPPDGSSFAVRLGNTNIGAQAERISYTIHVPVNDSNFSIKYDYAVVFEDPGHTSWTQPRFNAKLLDSATNTYIDCASFEYISTSGLPGFAVSPVDSGVIYKPWSSVFYNLRGHGGKTLYLEFTTADCVRRGHWGYAYVDVENICGDAVEINYDCTFPNITTLTGPPGFQFYNWWNQTYTTLLGTGQQITLNPGPSINTIIWLEVVPFNNFGCTDTLLVKITGDFTADFDAGDTTVVCAPKTFTFYNRNLPSTSTLWNFGDGTTGTGDTVSHTYALPGSYIVTLNVTVVGGCNGTAKHTINILQPTGSFNFVGVNSCNARQVRFDATVNNIDTLIWDFGDGTILQTTQTTVFHTYSLPGIYIPVLTVKSNGGCQLVIPGTDTVRIEMLDIGFTDTEQKICGSTTLNFTDTSHSYFGIVAYDWNFGDGNTGSGNTVSHTYTVTGTYNVQLIITGIMGCKDTIVKPINVSINAIPIAAITGDTVKCTSLAATFQGNVQSADPISSLVWSASNGVNGVGNSFTVIFNQAGMQQVQFIAGTINGCYDTVIHQILINPTPDVLQTPNQALCNGATTNAIAFTGSVSGTVYDWTNSAPSIGLPASGSGNIAPFTATSNGFSTSVASITVRPTAAGCTGPAKVFTITINPVPSVIQPPNQSLCNGATTNLITFTGGMGNTTYNWSNNNSSVGLAALGSGDIASFKVINTGNTVMTAAISVTPSTSFCPGASVAFFITVYPTPAVTAGNDRIVCIGSSLQLSANGASQYTWTPSTWLSCTNCPNPAATPLDSIKYVVQGVSSFGCMANDTVSLNVIKPFQMLVTPNDTLCIGESTNLRASGANNYLWSPPSGLNRTDIADPTATPNTTTLYRVVGYDGHNCFTDTNFIRIIVGPKPTLNIGPDLTLSTGSTVHLNPVTQNGPIINWSWTPSAGLSCTNCPTPILTVKDNSYYVLSVTNNYGCITNDTIFIFVFCKNAQVFIPNAFTPDGDGLNDVLMVRGKGIFIKTFRIFNRWGELVFEKTNFNPNDLQYAWDGKVRGVPATPDVFVYTADVICDNGIVYTYKGNTTLLK